jgi:hypothetical protein
MKAALHSFYCTRKKIHQLCRTFLINLLFNKIALQNILFFLKQNCIVDGFLFKKNVLDTMLIKYPAFILWSYFVII